MICFVSAQTLPPLPSFSGFDARACTRARHPTTKRRNTQKKESWGACACMQWLVKCCRGLDKSLKSYWYDVVRATPIHRNRRAYSLTLCHARTHARTHTHTHTHSSHATTYMHSCIQYKQHPHKHWPNEHTPADAYTYASKHALTILKHENSELGIKQHPAAHVEFAPVYQHGILQIPRNDPRSVGGRRVDMLQ